MFFFCLFVFQFWVFESYLTLIQSQMLQANCLHHHLRVWWTVRLNLYPFLARMLIDLLIKTSVFISLLLVLAEEFGAVNGQMHASRTAVYWAELRFLHGNSAIMWACKIWFVWFMIARLHWFQNHPIPLQVCVHAHCID